MSGFEPSRAARAAASAVLAALVLAGAACAQTDAPAAADFDNAPGQLYGRALDEIRDLYIEPMPLRQVALSGIAALVQLDGNIAVGDGFAAGTADTMTLRYRGRDVARYPEPASSDGRRWGELLDNIVVAARQASPALAALPQQKIENAVFRGIVAGLDPYSRYLDPETARDQRAERDGFGGIGVTIDTSDHLLRVAAVSPQGPADLAGLRPEDQIVAIDGIATAGFSQEEAVHQLRGPIGSTVALRVVRPGGTAPPRELNVPRAFVTEPTVAMSRAGDILVFRISTFNRTTAERVGAGIAEAHRESGSGLAGIVLDLRGNPGGLLDQAVSLADLFIRSGPILATVGRHPASRQYFAATGGALAPQVPVAVLVNGGSASASEVVAAALQDAGRGVVIGSASFGKGSVQTVLRLPNNGEMILTWARLVAPAGYLLQQHGVVPTLCTADLVDDASGLAAGLQRATAAIPGGSPPRPRAALDESGWTALRAACPPRRLRPVIDLQLAERVLADPALYGAARHALAAQVAQDPADR